MLGGNFLLFMANNHNCILNLLVVDLVDSFNTSSNGYSLFYSQNILLLNLNQNSSDLQTTKLECIKPIEIPITL